MPENKETTLYNKGVIEGRKHSTMSPETRDKIDNLVEHNSEQDIKLGNVITTLDYIKEGIDKANKQLTYTNGNVKENSIFRIKCQANAKLLIGILVFIGGTGAFSVIKAIIEHFKYV